jgi:hypothetical protein
MGKILCCDIVIVHVSQAVMTKPSKPVLLLNILVENAGFTLSLVARPSVYTFVCRGFKSCPPWDLTLLGMSSRLEHPRYMRFAMMMEPSSQFCY